MMVGIAPSPASCCCCSKIGDANMGHGIWVALIGTKIRPADNPSTQEEAPEAYKKRKGYGTPVSE
jgi:hypothetical protein